MRSNALPEEEDNPVVASPSEAEAAASGDSKAAQESEQFASGKSRDELAREAARAEHHRDQRFKRHFECLALIALWVMSGSLLLIGLFWLFHLLTPTTWHWLSELQLRDLRTLLTGGLVIGVLTDHFRKRLK